MYFSQLIWCCWRPQIKAAKEHLRVILLITNECARVKKKKKKDLWTSHCVCVWVCVVQNVFDSATERQETRLISSNHPPSIKSTLTDESTAVRDV